MLLLVGGFATFFLFQGRKKEEEADEEGGREREMSFLSPLFFFVGTVILGSDFVPVLGRRLGLVFSLISSPLLPRLENIGLGLVTTICRLALPSMRSMPSGIPPFSYYLICFPSLAPACRLQQQQEFFGAYSLDDLVCLLWFLLLSLLLELCRLILVGATNPFSPMVLL
jgi:hypothetical protein